jgi:hypothetical protein
MTTKISTKPNSNHKIIIVMVNIMPIVAQDVIFLISIDEKCTKKKVKKGTYSKKINDIKKNNNRENKYSTRGGNRIRNK